MWYRVVTVLNDFFLGISLQLRYRIIAEDDVAYVLKAIVNSPSSYSGNVGEDHTRIEG